MQLCFGTLAMTRQNCAEGVVAGWLTGASLGINSVLNVEHADRRWKWC
jgi:hypothetical protein